MAEIARLLDPVVNHIKRGLNINLVIGANENTDALFRAIPERQSNPGTDDGRVIDASDLARILDANRCDSVERRPFRVGDPDIEPLIDFVREGNISMPFSTDTQGREDMIIELFRATFTASEGAEEGALIGDLVHNLLASTAQQDRFVFIAEEEGAIIGGILFSRLTYERDERTVFVLAPVAVVTDQQGNGIGQRLLNHGLAALRSAGIDIVMTYGDPGYYAKVGFKPISEEDAPAPFKLKQPEGWLASSLTDRAMTPLKGPSRCVEALNDPVYW